MPGIGWVDRREASQPFFVISSFVPPLRITHSDKVPAPPWPCEKNEVDNGQMDVVQMKLEPCARPCGEYICKTVALLSSLCVSTLLMCESWTDRLKIQGHFYWLVSHVTRLYELSHWLAPATAS